MKGASKSNLWRFLPGIAISALAFFILSKLINYQDLLNSFKYFSISNILVFFLIIFLSLIARGFVWNSLLNDFSIKDAFFVINEGYLFNNLIPRSGEVVRIIISSAISKNDAFQVTAAIFFERAIDLIIAAGMFLATLSLALEMEWLRSTALYIFVLFTILLVCVLLIAIFAYKIQSYLVNRTSKFNFWERNIKPLIIKAIHGLTTISKPKKLLKGLFWILCSWVFWVLILYYAILQISPSAPLWWALFTEGIIALGIALPSAPASLGVYEGTMVFALSIFGIKSDIALSTAIIVHLVQILATSIFGLLGLFIHDFNISQIVSKIQTRLIKKKEIL